jgi:hypothetical protein
MASAFQARPIAIVPVDRNRKRRLT